MFLWAGRVGLGSEMGGILYPSPRSVLFKGRLWGMKLIKY